MVHGSLCCSTLPFLVVLLLCIAKLLSSPWLSSALGCSNPFGSGHPELGTHCLSELGWKFLIPGKSFRAFPFTWKKPFMFPPLQCQVAHVHQRPCLGCCVGGSFLPTTSRAGIGHFDQTGFYLSVAASGRRRCAALCQEAPGVPVR